MTILCIDPGSTKSGIVIVENNTIIQAAKIDNNTVLELIIKNDSAMLELPVAYTGGKTISATILWAGRFIQQALVHETSLQHATRQQIVNVIMPKAVKLALSLNKYKSRDSKVRQIVIRAIANEGIFVADGVKISADAWQAAAVYLALGFNKIKLYRQVLDIDVPIK